MGEYLGRSLVTADANHLRLDLEMLEQLAQEELLHQHADQQEVSTLWKPHAIGSAGDQVFFRRARLSPRYAVESTVLRAQFGDAALHLRPVVCAHSLEHA